MARIENHKYSIEEAFRECFYIVPDYQREYVWTDKEVHQLLEDIGEQIDAGHVSCPCLLFSKCRVATSGALRHDLDVPDQLR